MTSQLSALAGGLSFKTAKSYYSRINLHTIGAGVRLGWVSQSLVLANQDTASELKLNVFVVK